MTTGVGLSEAPSCLACPTWFSVLLVRRGPTALPSIGANATAGIDFTRMGHGQRRDTAAGAVAAGRDRDVDTSIGSRGCGASIETRTLNTRTDSRPHSSR